MRTTQTLVGDKARKAILSGVNVVYDPVSRTLGPAGKNALLYGTFGREPRITNDGYTVGDVQIPKDPFIRLASRAFQETCRKTNEKVGDGTTATTVIAGKLYNNAYNLLSSNIGTKMGGGQINVMDLKRKLVESAELVKKEILKSSTKIKTISELEKVISVSVEDKEIGKIIAEIVWEVGVDGYIDVVEGYNGKIETEIIKGARFPAKVAGKGFVNKKERFEMVGEDVAIILTNFKVDNANQLDNTLAPLVKKYPKIAILAPEFSNKVLEMMFAVSYPLSQDSNGKVTRVKGNIDLYPVLTPSLRDDQYDDLSVVCMANFIDKRKGMSLSLITENDLGFAEKIIVKDTENKDEATIIGGAGTKLNFIKPKDKNTGFDKEEEKVVKENTKTPVQERIEVLKGQLEKTRQPQFKELMKRRIASVSSAIGIIRVDAPTRAEAYYQKLKLEDGKCAGQSAMRGGYVMGGGLCLKNIADKKLKDSDILKSAITAPFEMIQSSMGGNFEIADTIIDPTEVIYYAVEHAVSVVSNLMTVDVLTIEEEDPVYGDGEFAIAKALNEFVLNDKKHKGLMKENEESALEDEKGGMNDDEWLTVNKE
jgi:chaperonin GroEL